MAGYQATAQFDTSALRYVESANGDYLPAGAFFVPPGVAGNRVTLAAASLAGVSNGDGTLATLTFQEFNAELALKLTERFEMHDTPTNGSWLNMAEIELSAISRQCLNRRIGGK